MASPARPPSLSRWETIGAWLHIWTAPKGVEVPPVPARKLALSGLALAVVIGAALALLIPQLDRAKERGAAERARAAAQADAAEAARLRADQRPHLARVASGQPLVGALEAAISADARARVRHGTMTGTVRGTTCQASPHYLSIYADSRVYKCFVQTSANFNGYRKGDVFATGYSFVATIYTAKRQLVWCKQNPHADEKGGRDSNHLAPSRRCAGKLSEVL